jgi:hypothetical protein
LVDAALDVGARSKGEGTQCPSIKPRDLRPPSVLLSVGAICEISFKILSQSLDRQVDQ